MHEGALGVPSAWLGAGKVYKSMIGDIGPVNLIVDIGIHWGYSMFKLAIDYPDAVVFGVDNFSYSDAEKARAHINAWKVCFKMIVLEGDSIELGKKFKLPIDILSIDGDHSYDGVKGDFDAWTKNLRRGGVVLFHDTEHYDNQCGVPRFFKELPGRKVAHSAGGPGVGIWFKE